MEYVFSIVIPIYNAEKFLKSTIESVIKQKNRNTEIILVDDNSTDSSIKICNFFNKKFNFIKLIKNKKNYGVGYCRNLAIKFASAEYIVFLDSDDALLDNSLNQLEKFIKINSSPEVIPVRFQKITYPQNNNKFIKDNLKNKSSKSLIKYVVKNKIPFSDCWFFVIKKKFLSENEINFPNSRFGESEIFVAKTICLMKRFACFQKKFYHKKDRINSLTHSSDYNTTKSVLNNLIQFNIFFNKNKFDILRKKFLQSYMQAIFGVLTALMILRKKNEINKLLKLLKKNEIIIKNLIKLPENINLKNIIDKEGPKEGLLKFIDLIKKKKMSNLKKINIKENIIFAYCRSQYSAATIKILNEKKISIKGIIDDNKNFINIDFMNLKTIDSKSLFWKYRKNLKNLIIIITHQKTNTFKKISNFLSKNKILKSKIYYIKY